MLEDTAPPPRTRHRVGFFGKLILQVEDIVPANYDPRDLSDTRTMDEVVHVGRWRDATIQDIIDRRIKS